MPDTIWTKTKAEFVVEIMLVRMPDKQTRTFYVEQAAPHRIVKWESSTGESSETTPLCGRR